MSRPSVWFGGDNDMFLQLSALRSSTMSSTGYLDGSTGVSVDVWKAATTSSTSHKIVSGRNLTYVTGSTGRYRGVVQSSEHAMAFGTAGLVIFKARHGTLNGEWRERFRVDVRR